MGKSKAIPILVTGWVPLWVMRVQTLPGSEELSWRYPMSRVAGKGDGAKVTLLFLQLM